MSFKSAMILRPVGAQDRTRLRDWRNQDFIRQASLTDHKITVDEHNAWFDNILSRDDGVWCVAELHGNPVGHVNAVMQDGGTWQWSFYIGDQNAPKGTGAAMLTLFLAELFSRDGVQAVAAQTVASNAASRHLHEKLGFVVTGEADDVLDLSLSRARWQDSQAIYDACLSRVLKGE